MAKRRYIIYCIETFIAYDIIIFDNLFYYTGGDTFIAGGAVLQSSFPQ